MKFKKFIALAVAVLTITMAFAPAALAAYAPTYWSQWPTQSIQNNSTTYTFALQNVLKGQYYLNNPSDLIVDGAFGNGTKAVVKRFNEDHEVSTNSYVNSATWTEMKNSCC